MGIDAVICATTSRALTRDELVECSARLYAAAPFAVDDYGDVPNKTPDQEGDGWQRDIDREDAGLCLQYRSPARLEDFGGLPAGRFVYEVCTLSRSVYMDDDDGQRTGGRGSGVEVAIMGEALELLMEPRSAPTWPRGPAPDWQVWYGNDASFFMQPFGRDVRQQMFTAYLRTEMGAGDPNAVALFSPCRVCGSTVLLDRWDSQAKVCGACRHNPATGKKHRPYRASLENSIPKNLEALLPSERRALVRSIGELLHGRGLQHQVVDYLLAYDDTERKG